MKQATVTNLIKKVEAATAAKVITYFTNEFSSSPFSTQIASDVIPLFKNILQKQGVVNKRVLILHTNGGSLDTAWPLVNLIRDYASKEFEVLIPSRALSVGTLISLGADRILMCKGSFLSPIDPTGIFQINQGGNVQAKQCSVEDMMGFIGFAKEKIGLKSQEALTETLRLITAEFPSSIVGSLNRTHSLIRNLAKKLMCIRKNFKKADLEKWKQIAKALIEDLFSHQHLINYREAREIGLDYVYQPMGETEKSSVALFEFYKKSLFLEEKKQEIDNRLRGAASGTPRSLHLVGSCVHSTDLSYNFEFNGDFSQAAVPTGGLPKPVLTINKQSWVQL